MLDMTLRLLPALLLTTLAAGEAVAPKPVARRLAERGFPSLFQAWNPAEHLAEPPLTTCARHDLVFHAPEWLGLAWNAARPGLATGFTADSVARALAQRKRLRQLNPDQIVLAEIRYRDAGEAYLPADHPWWQREGGQRVVGWEEGHYHILDFANADYRAQVARQCQAAVATGAFDGIMLDWWQDDEARLALLAAIRSAIGAEALILVNANDRRIPRSAPLVNGLFMECWQSRKPDNWPAIAETLAWAEANLRQPRINCLETWFEGSRQDLARMRATTTLSLTRSDGFCLFSDPNELPTPDHLHDWYPFWQRSLGRPTAVGKQRPDGAWQREFALGTAVYNPPGNAPVTLAFAEDRRSAASGTTARSFTVPAFDGDLFLSQPAKP